MRTRSLSGSGAARSAPRRMRGRRPQLMRPWQRLRETSGRYVCVMFVVNECKPVLTSHRIFHACRMRHLHKWTEVLALYASCIRIVYGRPVNPTLRIRMDLPLWEEAGSPLEGPQDLRTSKRLSFEAQKKLFEIQESVCLGPQVVPLF